MLRTFIPFMRPGRALELGCYLGEFTALLKTQYSDVTVVEASSELVERARARVGSDVTFIESTFETVQLDKQYDCIVLMHTLEHLDEPVQVLRKVNDWLSPDGRLFLVVPNANAPSRQIAVKMGLIENNAAVTPAEREHGHRITYTFDTLERDARKSGLRVVHRGGVFFKALANYQFDKLLGGDVITEGYLEGCYQLGMVYPDLCASIYLVCERGPRD
jgi:2-polyprenyl-3-methyl-5-hydroxy-6-metoxy-1,4-benzoquinol methylase